MELGKWRENPGNYAKKSREKECFGFSLANSDMIRLALLKVPRIQSDRCTFSKHPKHSKLSYTACQFGNYGQMVRRSKEVRKKLFTFLAKPDEDHDFLTSLLALGRTPTDCYIGLCF